jgi:hypothetical protein
VKRFAANFVLAESGVLLKNGILETDDAGNVLRILDTKGDLRESSQLVFQNGILIPGFRWVKTGSADTHHPFLALFPESDRINLQNLIEAGKKFQEQFPGKTVLDFFAEAVGFLVQSGDFQKIMVPGVSLLIGADLLNMKFSPKSRLKKLL